MAFQPEEKTFYTLSDVSEHLSVTIYTLRNWIKAGKLKASLVGRGYMIRGEDIQNFLTHGSRINPDKIKAKKKNKH